MSQTPLDRSMHPALPGATDFALHSLSTAQAVRFDAMLAEKAMVTIGSPYMVSTIPFAACFT